MQACDMIQRCAGILFFRLRKESEELEFFMVSPGGPAWRNRFAWAPPKGHIEKTDHDSWDAAKREFEEETGVHIQDTETPKINPILFVQRKDKEVVLYPMDYDTTNVTINIEECHSNMFEWKDGNEYPEVEHYRWLTYDELKGSVVRAYGEIIKQIVKMYNENVWFMPNIKHKTTYVN